MSWTAEDWERERRHAIEIKRKLHELIDAIDCIDQRADELAREMGAIVETLAKQVDELIGVFTITWANEHALDR